MSKTFLLTLAAISGLSCIRVVERMSSGDEDGASTVSMKQGQSVTAFFNDTCAKCHGESAQGGGGGTKSLIVEDKIDQKWDKPFFDAIKNGIPDMGMEAYGATMTDQQIWGQVVHIRELQAKGLRAKNGDPKPDASGVFKGTRHDYKIEEVIGTTQGLKVPWAIDWLSDGRMLITNRPGFMVLAKGGTVGDRIEGLPESKEQGQGGLMEVAVHPDYAKNGWIYLAYSEPGGKGAMTKIVRGKLAGSKWTGQETIWEADKEFYNGAGIHFGSRIAFDGKGHVFFVVGERGGNMLAQETSNPFGKIYRLNEDGTEPKDNPFVGKGIKGIWSLGHRNPQGLTIDLNGDLWDTEHGPRGGDEVNRIEKGVNYGWPVIAFSINYNDAANWVPWGKPDTKFGMPAFRWLPSIGACGLDTVRGPAFPAWKGDLVAGGLSGANVDRLRMKDGKLVEREELIHGMGRVREVTVGPDGFVYIALNEPDKIIRIVPAK